MKQSILTGALGALLLVGIEAQETKRVRGSGPDASAATKAALIEAVRQVAGVQVTTNTISEKEFNDILRNVTDKFSESELGKEHVQLASGGFVRSYSVVEQGRQDNGAIYVVIEAMMAKPGEVRADGIRTLRVSPVQVDSRVRAQTAPLLARELLRQLRMTMTETRRFRVLETEAVADMEAILDKVRNDPDFSSEDRAKLGQKLSADLVLMSTVRELVTETMQKPPVRVSGVVVKSFPKKLLYKIVIDYRIVDVARLEVVKTGEETLTNVEGPDPLQKHPPTDSLEQAAAEHLAKALSQRVVGHVDGDPAKLAPLKVADVADGEIYIATGGPDRVKIGDVFRIVSQGREIRDPDTNALLGHRQRQLGTVRVSEVQGKFAIAEPVGEVDLSKVAKGALLVPERR